MKILVTIAQRLAGRSYTGTLELEGKLFDFTLTYGIPVGQIDTELKRRDYQIDMLKSFPLHVRVRGGPALGLSAQDHLVLFVALSRLAQNLSEHPLVKAIREERSLADAEVYSENTFTLADWPIPKALLAA